MRAPIPATPLYRLSLYYITTLDDGKATSGLLLAHRHAEDYYNKCENQVERAPALSRILRTSLWGFDS
jgi:hypothetical protein